MRSIIARETFSLWQWMCDRMWAQEGLHPLFLASRRGPPSYFPRVLSPYDHTAFNTQHLLQTCPCLVMDTMYNFTTFPTDHRSITCDKGLVSLKKNLTMVHHMEQTYLSNWLAFTIDFYKFYFSWSWVLYIDGLAMCTHFFQNFNVMFYMWITRWWPIRIGVNIGSKREFDKFEFEIWAL